MQPQPVAAAQLDQSSTPPTCLISNILSSKSFNSLLRRATALLLLDSRQLVLICSAQIQHRTRGWHICQWLNECMHVTPDYDDIAYAKPTRPKMLKALHVPMRVGLSIG